MSARQKTVLSVAYPFAAVGPDAVGGAEQVLAMLESALVRSGFRSLVAARAGAVVAGEVIGVHVPDGLLTPAVRNLVEGSMQAAIDSAASTGSVDLIHMHGIDFHRYTVPADVPVLVTLHLPPSWYPADIWDLPERYTLQCVSENQKVACPANARNRIVVVENGVPLGPEDDSPPRERFALLLSRICAEKDLHTAIDAASRAGVPVVLAGKVYPYPEHLEYFAREIEPRLGGAVRFIGPVGGATKLRLLQQASCLLVPSVAQETSSLVAMEALAAGTPVIARPSGALPTIVEQGRTGFLVNDGSGMEAALSRLDEIDPQVCRQVARERFSAGAMVDRYLALYAKLLR